MTTSLTIGNIGLRGLNSFRGAGADVSTVFGAAIFAADAPEVRHVVIAGKVGVVGHSYVQF